MFLERSVQDVVLFSPAVLYSASGEPVGQPAINKPAVWARETGQGEITVTQPVQSVR